MTQQQDRIEVAAAWEKYKAAYNGNDAERELCRAEYFDALWKAEYNRQKESE